MTTTHICERCGKNFKQKSHLDAHMKRKRPCKKDDTLTKLVEAKVEEKVNELMNIHIMENLGTDGERNELICDSKTKRVRDEGLDKFYTNPDIVKICINELTKIIKWRDYDLIVEPSAGNGSFYLNIPHSNKIGLDISPEHPLIHKQDFFTFTPPSSRKIMVIGNPPFGKISSLAIKFFNHSAEWSDTIAFIIPRTFRRNSVQNQLNLNFHLVYDMDIPMKPCSFTPKMTAKCCFQVWEKKMDKRHIIKLPLSHRDWKFLKYGEKDSKGQPTPPNGADFVIKAYGGKCGEIKRTDLSTLRPKSWHWIKSNININLLIERFQTLDYSFSENTVRQNSIGRAELVKLYTDTFG